MDAITRLEEYQRVTRYRANYTHVLAVQSVEVLEVPIEERVLVVLLDLAGDDALLGASDMVDLVAVETVSLPSTMSWKSKLCLGHPAW